MIAIVTIAHRSFDLLMMYIDGLLEYASKYVRQGRIEFVLLENTG